MRYADTLLADGESIVLRTKQHWLSLFLEARWAVVLWAAAIVLLVVSFNVTGGAAQIASWAALVCLIVGLFIFGYNYWQWWAQDYLVTNRRLMKVTGIINKRSADSSLEKINDAVLEQNLLGRIMNYGDLDILTAADQAVDSYKMLKGPKEFKRVMLNQKHGLEMEYQGVRPSPPMRSSPVNMNGEPAVRSAPPPPPPAPAAEWTPEPVSDERMPDERMPGEVMPDLRIPGEVMPDQPAHMAQAAPSSPPADDSSDASLEITQTLARLADLRDKGAISEEEYAAKKADLLGRL
jgi:hypothetical protein